MIELLFGRIKIFTGVELSIKWLERDETKRGLSWGPGWRIRQEEADQKKSWRKAQESSEVSSALQS